MCVCAHGIAFGKEEEEAVRPGFSSLSISRPPEAIFARARDKQTHFLHQHFVEERERGQVYHLGEIEEGNGLEIKIYCCCTGGS